jgi:hypothetical protein
VVARHVGLTPPSQRKAAEAAAAAEAATAEAVAAVADFEFARRTFQIKVGAAIADLDGLASAANMTRAALLALPSVLALQAAAKTAGCGVTVRKKLGKEWEAAQAEAAEAGPLNEAVDDSGEAGAQAGRGGGGAADGPVVNLGRWCRGGADDSGEEEETVDAAEGEGGGAAAVGRADRRPAGAGPQPYFSTGEPYTGFRVRDHAVFSYSKGSFLQS